MEIVRQQLRDLLNEFREQNDYAMSIGNVDRARAWDSAADRLEECMVLLGIE